MNTDGAINGSMTRNSRVSPASLASLTMRNGPIPLRLIKGKKRKRTCDGIFMIAHTHTHTHTYKHTENVYNETPAKDTRHET